MKKVKLKKKKIKIIFPIRLVFCLWATLSNLFGFSFHYCVHPCLAEFNLTSKEERKENVTYLQSLYFHAETRLPMKQDPNNLQKSLGTYIPTSILIH